MVSVLGHILGLVGSIQPTSPSWFVLLYLHFVMRLWKATLIISDTSSVGKKGHSKSKGLMWWRKRAWHNDDYHFTVKL